MSLIGKRYPATLEDFYKSKLPGEWNSEMAGKRMKLPVPETWETQVSLKGNKAETWQELIDHKKLPFMAMLRNLRNMIKSGMSEKHHNWVLKKLTTPGAIINSKQFPFRFFTAYDVLDQLEVDYRMAKHLKEEGRTCRKVGKKGEQARKRREVLSSIPDVKPGQPGYRKKTKIRLSAFGLDLIQRYHKALDTAVKIATNHNVKPIKGRTVLFLRMEEEKKKKMRNSRTYGKSVQEISVLLALMCKYACEDAKLVLFSDTKYREVELEAGTILKNMSSVISQFRGEMLGRDFFELLQAGKEVHIGVEDPSAKHVDFVSEDLQKFLVDRRQIDNLVYIGSSKEQTRYATINNFLSVYRRIVNPNLLFVKIDPAGKQSSSDLPYHQNDVLISGYSDQILRFIAERGDEGQLGHVEKMDRAYNLNKDDKDKGSEWRNNTSSVARPLAVPALVPKWRTVRVFISSTFRDMHSERDILTRFVFPELRAKARDLFVHVHEVDFRWGITEHMSKEGGAVSLCLTEAQRCPYFVGILGQRYGYVPSLRRLPTEEIFDWALPLVTDIEGSSVTELEMSLGALWKASQVRGKAFFYLRDAGFMVDLPEKYRGDFETENEAVKARLTDLKRRIQRSGLEVYSDYPCQWAGELDDLPVLTGLELFGTRVLNNLWTAVQRDYGTDQSVFMNEDDHINSLYESFVEEQAAMFVGRSVLHKSLVKVVEAHPSGLVLVSGKTGTGKTALLAATVRDVRSALDHCNVLVHFVGAAPGSANVVALLRRLCGQLMNLCGVPGDIPPDYPRLVALLANLLNTCSEWCVGVGGRVVVVLDGLDLLDDVYQARGLAWLPHTMPAGVLLVLGVREAGPCLKVLQAYPKVSAVTVGPLQVLDKSEIIRHLLSRHLKSLSDRPFDNQLTILTNKKDAVSPLFLHLACEEIKLFGVFERLSGELRQFPSSITLLLQRILTRLERDLGVDLVQTALTLLLAARNGLTAEELGLAVSLYRSNKQEERAPPISLLMGGVYSVVEEETVAPAVLGQLLQGLKCLLRPLPGSDGHILRLVHTEVCAAVRQRYRGASLQHAHDVLARVFLHLCGGWAFTAREARPLQELPFHLLSSNRAEDLLRAMTNPLFIGRKFELGLGVSLMEDFDLSQELVQGHLQDSWLESYLAYRKFVSNNLQSLAACPGLLWQQALNQPLVSPVYRDALALQKSGHIHTELWIMEWLNRPQEDQPCLYTLSGLPQCITCLAICADGQTLAAGGEDGVVYLYQLSTGKELANFTGHSDVVTDVCFVGPSNLCSASADGTLSLWSLTNGCRLAVMKGHSRRVSACSSDRKGQYIVSAGWDNCLKVWSASGSFLYDLSLEEFPLTCVSWHPEGSFVAVGGWDSKIKVWDVYNRKRKAVLRGHVTSVRAMAYSPSGRYLASAALGGEVKLWSALNGTMVGQLSGHTLPVNRLVFAPHGDQLITVADDHQVKVWSGHMGQLVSDLSVCTDPVSRQVVDPATAVCLYDSDQVMVGYHSGRVACFQYLNGDLKASLQISDKPIAILYRSTVIDEKILVISGDGTLAKLQYSSDSPASLTLVKPQYTRFDVSSDGTVRHGGVSAVTCTRSLVITGGQDGRLAVYREDHSSTTWKLKLLYTAVQHTAPVTGCAVSTDRRTIYTVSRDGSIVSWTMAIDGWAGDMQFEPTISVKKGAHNDWINACSLATSNNMMATASNDFNIKVWDMKKDSSKTLVGHTANVNTVSYEYGCIVSGSSDGEVKVWSHKGNEITSLKKHSKRVNAVHMIIELDGGDQQPDPDLETEVKVTDWAAEVEESERQKDCEAASTTPTGARKMKKMMSFTVASCSDDGTVKVWRPLEGTELATLTGHTDRVLAVASSSTDRLVTSGLDRSIRVWTPQYHDTDQDQLVQSGHQARVTALCAVKFGQRQLLVSGDGAGWLMVWDPLESSGPQGLRPLIRQKMHVSSVSDMCYLTQADLLYTGSEDGSVIAWQPSLLNGRPQLSCSWTNSNDLDRSCPVSLMVYNASEQYLMALLWDGRKVKNIDLNGVTTSKILNKQVAALDCYPCWFFGGFFHDQHLYLATMHSDPIVLNTDKDFELEPVNFTEKSSPETIPTRPVGEEWVTSLHKAGDRMFVGKSSGTLRVLELGKGSQQKLLLEKQIHGSDITSILGYKDQVIITASRDGTIKLWTKDLDKQLGYFYTQAPVVKAIVVDVNRAMIIVYGDSLGNINCINANCQI